MIRLIEALNFRSLRSVRIDLADFQILIGPNASGKTTLFDVVAFLGDLLNQGLGNAIAGRVRNIQELFHFGQGDRFELAVEMRIPEQRRKLLGADNPYDNVRYEIAVGLDVAANEYLFLGEQLWLLDASSRPPPQTRQLFPMSAAPPQSILQSDRRRKSKKLVLRKTPGRNDNFYSEVADRKGKGGWAPSIRLGPRKSGLANLPDDETKFPVTTWFRETLVNGTQKLELNSAALRTASAPGRGLLFLPDGSNLPWVIHDLRQRHPARFKMWIEHLQTALPDIDDVVTAEIPDRHERYLQVKYRGGFQVPSWNISDGTLRMLALTLPAYLPDFTGVYLIEEPENGIHPKAMETVYQALRSAGDRAQILTATHSPVLLSCADLKEILCFKKDRQGATDIVAGHEHPALKQWKGTVSLANLYASGVLG
jgi:predicted ATPase